MHNTSDEQDLISEQDPSFLAKLLKGLKWLREVLWPIYGIENKKFLPMGLMMMFILYIYTLVRDLKDTLVVNAPSGGAECLSFLKLYGVTPAAVLFMIIFIKLANKLNKERLFYTIIVPFLAFFSIFSFFIYPNKEILHMSLDTMSALQAKMPNLHWFIPVIGNWSFSLFYILAELWGSVILAMLFWQFANQITKIEEAKRFYGLFGMVGNIGLILSGETIMRCSSYAKSLLGKTENLPKDKILNTLSVQEQTQLFQKHSDVLMKQGESLKTKGFTLHENIPTLTEKAKASIAQLTQDPTLSQEKAQSLLKTAKSSIQSIQSLQEGVVLGINIKYQMAAVAISGAVVIYAYYWMNRKVLTDPRLYQEGQGSGKKKGKVKMSIGESFKYIITNPYLLLIAVLVLSYGVAINLVEGVWKGQIKIAFPDPNDYASFMGQFSQYTGIVTIILMFVGNNIIRKFSWCTASIITPIMVVVTSVIFFFTVWKGVSSDPFSPIFGTSVVMLSVIVGLVQNILSKGTKYSLFDATKQMAYIPLDPESKTKGQAAVEVIGGRAGKSGGALIQSTLLATIGGGVTLSSLTYILGPITIIICLLWIASVFKLSGRFEAMKAQSRS